MLSVNKDHNNESQGASGLIINIGENLYRDTQAGSEAKSPANSDITKPAIDVSCNCDIDISIY